MLADIAADNVMRFQVALEMALLSCSVLALVTWVEHASTVSPGVQSERCLRLVALVALFAEVGFVVRVSEPVHIKVVATSALVGALWALERFHPLMDPHVLLQICAGPMENPAAVWALVCASPHAAHHPWGTPRRLQVGMQSLLSMRKTAAGAADT